MGVSLDDYPDAGRYNGRGKDDPTRIRQSFGVAAENSSLVGFRSPTNPGLIARFKIGVAVDEHATQTTCRFLKVLHVLGSQQCIDISHDALIVIVSIKAHCTCSGQGCYAPLATLVAEISRVMSIPIGSCLQRTRVACWVMVSRLLLPSCSDNSEANSSEFGDTRR